MKSLSDQEIPHKSPSQVDPIDYEHDSYVCDLEYETACPNCRARFFPERHRDDERIRLVRAKLIEFLCEQFDASPEEICRAIREIVGDVIIDDKTGGAS